MQALDVYRLLGSRHDVYCSVSCQVQLQIVTFVDFVSACIEMFDFQNVDICSFFVTNSVA